MSTRSTISIEDDNGVRTISCRYDGSPVHVGRTLQSFYDTAEKAEALLAHGNAQALHGRIGEKHDPDAKNIRALSEMERPCSFYVRDFGQSMSEHGPRTYPNFHEASTREDGAYHYRFSDGRWSVWIDEEIDLIQAVVAWDAMAMQEWAAHHSKLAS